MTRNLIVNYQLPGLKIGKLYIFLDGREVLALGNHSSGRVAMSEDRHEFKAVTWGRTWKLAVIPEGCEDWYASIKSGMLKNEIVLTKASDTL